MDGALEVGRALPEVGRALTEVGGALPEVLADVAFLAKPLDDFLLPLVCILSVCVTNKFLLHIYIYC